MRSFLFLCGLMGAISASAALAQTMPTVGPGSVIRGELTDGDPRAGNRIVDCYVLPTEPGTQWRIMQESNTIDSYLELGRGDCLNFTLDRSNDDTLGIFLGSLNSRIDFTAGGGVYIIRAAALGGGRGAYTLRVEQRPGTSASGRLPAGGVYVAPGPWNEPGWIPPTASTSPDPQGIDFSPGTVFRDCEAVCPEMVVLAAGSFMMGSPATEDGRDGQEGPRHAVAFAYPFAIGRYEVTFDEYDACVEDGGCAHRPSDQGWGRGRRPVVNVSWNDAQAYVDWLSDKTGRRYHLPSEAEWEYAARAGTDTPWHTGVAILTDDANILNAFGRTVVVGGYPPNAFGLYDMHGNVAEWTLDCMDTGYVGVPTDGSAATSGDCTKRIYRGGWLSAEPALARSAKRMTHTVTERRNALGFRVARSL